jgi:hypothetical protein
LNLGAPEGLSVPGPLSALEVLLTLWMLFFLIQSHDWEHYLSVLDNNRANSFLNGNMTWFVLPLFYNIWLRFASMKLHNACHYILKTDCCCTLTIGYDFGFVFSIDWSLLLEGSAKATFMRYIFSWSIALLYSYDGYAWALIASRAATWTLMIHPRHICIAIFKMDSWFDVLKTVYIYIYIYNCFERFSKAHI